MKKDTLVKLTKNFEESAHVEAGIEYWLEKRIGELERLEARKKLTQTEKELSATLYEHGIDDQGFARIRSKGDQALFGGRTTIEVNNFSL
jgi:hypothetical protein